MPRQWNKSLSLIIALQAVVASAFAFLRTAEGDEGFYLAAAQRVLDGMTLYKDFFFPQMPFMALIFSPLSHWGITSLIVLRLFGVVAGVLLTLLMYRVAEANVDDRRAATKVAFLAAFNGMFLAWHSVFKPFAYVDLFLFASFAFLMKVGTDRRTNYRDAFLSMFFLAIAFNFRSLFLLMLPLFLYVLYVQTIELDLSNSKLRTVCVAGLLLPTLPTMVLFLNNPSGFWFSNLTFHLNREPIDTFAALLLHKATVLGKFLALPQTILLWGSVIASYFLIRYKLVNAHKLFNYSLITAIAIAGIYLIPTPVHLQYFQDAVPYLIMAALPVLIHIGKIR